MQVLARGNRIAIATRFHIGAFAVIIKVCQYPVQQTSFGRYFRVADWGLRRLIIYPIADAAAKTA